MHTHTHKHTLTCSYLNIAILHRYYNFIERHIYSGLFS